MALVLILNSLLCFQAKAASISLPTLTPTMLESISKDGIYRQETKITNAPWPEYTLVVPLKISALNAISIFSQYEKQKEYVPGVIRADIVRKPSPTDIHVAFEMHMPWPLANTFYTTGNRLHALNNESYAVEWYYVQSDSTKENRGQATFIAGPTSQQSYLHYRSFIYPYSRFATLVRSKVMSDLENTIVSIRNYLETEAKKSPAAVANYAQELRQLLQVSGPTEVN